MSETMLERDVTLSSDHLRRILRRHVCAWCDQRLDKDQCGALYSRCTAEDRKTRREGCIANYRRAKLSTSKPEGEGK